MLSDLLSDMVRGVPNWLLHRGIEKLANRHLLLLIPLVALVTPAVVVGYALIAGFSTFAILALGLVVAVFVVYGYTLLSGRAL
jgi:hypothetical protein